MTIATCYLLDLQIQQKKNTDFKNDKNIDLGSV